MTRVGTTCDPMNQRSQASSCSTGSSTARATSRTSRSVLDDKVYDHVLRLLGFDSLMYPDHPVIEALQHGCYTDFTSVFSLRRSDVESLTYLDTSVQPPVRKLLPKCFQIRLLVPQGYRNHFETTNKRPIDQTDWMCATVEDIKVYMMSTEFMYFNNSDAMSTNVPASPTSVPKVEAISDVLVMTIKDNHSDRFDGSSPPPILASCDSKEKRPKIPSLKSIKRVDSTHDCKRRHDCVPTDIANYSNLDNVTPLLATAQAPAHLNSEDIDHPSVVDNNKSLQVAPTTCRGYDTSLQSRARTPPRDSARVITDPNLVSQSTPEYQRLYQNYRAQGARP